MSVKSVTTSLIGLFPFLLLTACGGNTPAPPAASAPAQQAAPAEVASPASDDALTPLFGTWALSPAQCSEQTLKISKARFEGPGGGCDISTFGDNGNGTYTATMSCGAEGKKAEENIQMRPIFGPSGEGIDLVYLNRDNLASTVYRCPVPKP